MAGRRECAGKLLSAIVPDALPAWLRQLDRVRHTHEPASFETATSSKEGWLSVSLSHISFEHPGRVALVISDITPRKRAEAALAASEARLRLIVENAREYAIFAMDPARRIESWNSGAEAILGYAAHEVLGRSGDLIFTPEDCAAGAPEREAATAIATGRASDERWHIRKDGSRFFGSGVMTAMRDDAGELVGLLKIFRDQTDELRIQQAIEESRRRLQQALEEAEEARRDAEAATQAKDRFLAVLSHELRTPLTPALLGTELLIGRDDLPADVRETLLMIRRNVKLEAHFVDDLLDVTRIARGMIELNRVPIDAHDAVRGAIEITFADFDAKRQVVVVELRAKRSRILGDASRLHQLVWNLLKNASKFTPPGGSIRVRSRNEADTLVVDVADTGIGIDPAKLASIFDAFVQADPAIARTYGGLGLGLAIARATALAHGGALDAHSDGPGRGTTFTLSLPLAPADGTPAR
jgi:two-component system CheB/CheR fusion protein